MENQIKKIEELIKKISNDENLKGNVYTNYNRDIYFMIEDNNIYVSNMPLENYAFIGSATNEEIKEAKKIDDDLIDLLEWDEHSHSNLSDYLNDFEEVASYCNGDIDEMLKGFESLAAERETAYFRDLLSNFQIVYDRLKQASSSLQDYFKFVDAYYERKKNECYVIKDDLFISLHDFFVDSYDGPTNIEDLEDFMDYESWVNILNNVEDYFYINMYNADGQF